MWAADYDPNELFAIHQDCPYCRGRGFCDAKIMRHKECEPRKGKTCVHPEWTWVLDS